MNWDPVKDIFEEKKVHFLAKFRLNLRLLYFRIRGLNKQGKYIWMLRSCLIANLKVVYLLYLQNCPSKEILINVLIRMPSLLYSCRLMRNRRSGRNRLVINRTKVKMIQAMDRIYRVFSRISRKNENSQLSSRATNPKNPNRNHSNK